MFEKTHGCLVDARVFDLDASRYAGKAPPPELVQSETRGWSFTSDGHGSQGLVGVGSSSKVSGTAK